MTDDGLTPRLNTFLAAQRMLDDGLHGFSADEIEAMPMDSYREIRRRAGLPDVDPYSDAYTAYEPPGVQRQEAPEQPQRPADAPQSAPQGITDEQFHAWRQSRVSGGEGVGILNQAGRVAARNQVGRTAYSQGNVEPPARIERVFIQDSPVRGRSNFYK